MIHKTKKYCSTTLNVFQVPLDSVVKDFRCECEDVIDISQ